MEQIFAHKKTTKFWVEIRTKKGLPNFRNYRQKTPNSTYNLYTRERKILHKKRQAQQGRDQFRPSSWAFCPAGTVRADFKQWGSSRRFLRYHGSRWPCNKAINRTGLLTEILPLMGNDGTNVHEGSQCSYVILWYVRRQVEKTLEIDFKVVDFNLLTISRCPNLPTWPGYAPALKLL